MTDNIINITRRINREKFIRLYNIVLDDAVDNNESLSCKCALKIIMDEYPFLTLQKAKRIL